MHMWVEYKGIAPARLSVLGIEYTYIDIYIQARKLRNLYLSVLKKLRDTVSTNGQLNMY